MCHLVLVKAWSLISKIQVFSFLNNCIDCNDHLPKVTKWLSIREIVWGLTWKCEIWNVLIIREIINGPNQRSKSSTIFQYHQLYQNISWDDDNFFFFNSYSWNGNVSAQYSLVLKLYSFALARVRVVCCYYYFFVFSVENENAHISFHDFFSQQKQPKPIGYF